MLEFKEYDNNMDFFDDINNIVQNNPFGNNIINGIRVKPYKNNVCSKYAIFLDGVSILFAYIEPGKHFLFGKDKEPVSDEAVKFGLDNFAKKGITIPSLIAEKDLNEQIVKYYANKNRVYIPNNQMTCMVCRNVRVFDAYGNMRIAEEKDLHSLTCWMQNMAVECNLEKATYEYRRAILAYNLSSYRVWEVDGKIVSCLKAFQCGDGGAISNVYTPDNQRNKGYAKALVSLSTYELLQKFPYCSLNVSDVNPIPNRVYKSIGYEYDAKIVQGTFIDRA